MSSPVISTDFPAQTPDLPLCEAFQLKLLNNELMASLLGYLFTSTGAWTTDVATDLLLPIMESVSPIGYATLWVPFAGNAIDAEEWVPANGQAVSRATYARLFARYGTIYGAGDGSTTFNMPDWRDKFPLHAGSAHPAATTGGEEEVTLTEAEMPEHTHTLAFEQNGASGSTLWPQRENGAVTPTYPTGGTTGSTGGGDPHNNMPPYISGTLYIRANHKWAGTIL